MKSDLRSPRLVAFVLAFLAFLIMAPRGEALPLSKFFPYGTTAGDTTLPQADDTSTFFSFSGLTANGFPFLGKGYTGLYLNNNGNFTFNTSSQSYVPTPFPQNGIAMLAPLWSDVDTFGIVSGQPTEDLVYYRLTSSASDMAAMKTLIANAYLGGANNFTPTFGIVVTWNYVAAYGGGNLEATNSLPAGTPLNTFQAILMSDGFTTYAVFNYMDGGINWFYGTASDNAYPTVGFDAGDGANYYNLPQSGTAQTANLPTLSNTTPAVAGQFVFRIDQITATNPNPLATIGNDRTWKGGSGNWTSGEPTNWSGTTGWAGTNAVFPAGTNTATLTSAITAGGIDVSGTTTLTSSSAQTLLFTQLQNEANSTLAVSGATALSTSFPSAIINGSITLSGTSSLTLGTESAWDGGSITLENTATIHTKAFAASQSRTSAPIAGQTVPTLTFVGGGTFSMEDGTTYLGAVSSTGNAGSILDATASQPGYLVIDFDSPAGALGIASAPSSYSGTIAVGSSLLSLVKEGTGTQILSGTNTYAGTTEVKAGVLQFAKPVSLDNATTTRWTNGTFTVQDGAAAGFNVGGPNDFTPAQVASIRDSGAVFQPYSFLGLDPSNAPGASYTSSSPLTNAGTAVIGLEKLGANSTLVLEGNNTYTGGTIVAAGTLKIDSGATVSASVSDQRTYVVPPNDFQVLAGATLTGTGTSWDPVHLQSEAVLSFPNTTGTLTMVDGLTWDGSQYNQPTMKYTLSSTDNSCGSFTLTAASVAGVFTKGTGVYPDYIFDFGGTGKPETLYTLGTFRSTTFSPADFTAVNIPAGYSAHFIINTHYGTDGSGNTIQALQVEFVPPAPVVTSSALIIGTVGTTPTYQVTATGSAPIATYSAYNLPGGLFMDTYTGLITGTPIQAGVSFGTFYVTDIYGSTGALNFTFTILKGTPVITWPSPAPIVALFTPLGPAQLNATAQIGGAAVAGVFTYTPASGTLLGPGANQTLSVSFVPNDSADFNSATGTTTITVQPVITPYSVTYDGGAHTATNSSAGPAGPVGWQATGSMTKARTNGQATNLALLSNGQVLAAGGEALDTTTASAELYNPSTGSWTATGSMLNPRTGFTPIVLSNGKVLVAAGYSQTPSGTTYLAAAELYNSSTGTWSATGPLSVARGRYAAVLLANGKVLVCGGYHNGSVVASAEIYDPSSGNWSVTGPMATARAGTSAFLLASGKVLVAGGETSSSSATTACELYDPSTGTWSATGAMLNARRGGAIIALASGKILAAGGYIDSSSVTTATAEVYDPSSGAWTATGSMLQARYQFAANLISNGQVIVEGGVADGNPLSEAEIYDPVSGVWYVTGSLNVGREFQASVVLGNGSVLVAGGTASAGATASAEVGTIAALLNLAATTHTNAGTYTDTWTFHDPSGQYPDASGTVIDTIGQANATVTVTPYAVTYDGAAHTATGSAKGVLGESLTGLVLSDTTHTNAGNYAADPWIFADSTGNYKNTNGSVADSIGQANATVTVTPYAVTYDGAAHTAAGSAKGVLGESLTGLVLSGTTHTNAGNYATDPWTFTDSTGNYKNSNGSVADSIGQANATVTVTPYAVTYDGAAHTAAGSAKGVLGESLTGLVLSGTTHTNAGNYATDPWTFTDSTGNYKNSNGSVADSIGQANATVTVTPYAVTYDGAAHTAAGSAKGVLGESLTGLVLSGTTHTNAGNYATDPWTFTDSTGNYKNSNGSVADSIGQANATVTVTPYAVTYDENVHQASGTVTGVLGQALGGLDLSGTAHANAGTYATDPWTFTDSTGNYKNTNGSVSDSIAKANAAITVTPYSVTYDGNPHVATGTAKGIKGEALAGLLLSGTTHTNAGTYASDGWTFTDATGNYSNANGSISDSIGQANATVTLSNLQQTYSGSPESVTVTTSPAGLANSVTYNGSLTVPTNPGSYAVVATVTEPNHSGSASGTLTIASALSLTVPANLTAEATDIHGAIVAFAATATDQPASASVTYSHNPGTMFPIGSTTVNVTASDSTGNQATGSFTVTVQDTTAPVLSVTDASDFSETFAGYTSDNPSGIQYQSGLTVWYGGAVPGWTASGVNAIHAVDLTGGGDFAVEIWQDNVITSTKTTADNASGADYVVRFNAGPAVWAIPSQTTTATDGLLIQVLRADNSVLKQFTYLPGVWAGGPTLVPVSFHYTGDGSGPLHLSIGPSAPNSGHFGGAINDIRITPSALANLTLTATGPTGAAATFNATSADLVSGSVLVTTSAASGSTFPLGTTTVTAAATDAAGNTATGSFTVTVNPAVATFTFTTPSYTYDGTAKMAIATTSPSGLSPTYTYSGGGGAPVNAGTYTVTATVSLPWVAGSADSTLTIAPAAPTITATPYAVTYDGLPHAASVTATGAGGIDLGADLNLSATVHTNAGAYAGDSWSFSDPAGNYLTASGTLNDSIAKADATITISPYHVTYDGLAHTATSTATGVKGETLTGVNVGGTSHTSAGTYATDAWTFTDSTGNYNNTSGTTSDAIAKANVTVAVTPYSVTYDGNAHTATATIGGVNGETPTQGLDLSGTTHTSAGTYATDAWAYTDQTGNYNNSSGTVSDAIGKAHATIAVTAYNVTYDGSAHTATFTATGVKGEPLAGVDVSGTTHTTTGVYASDPWTYADSTGNYANASGTVSDTIGKATPVFSWGQPAAIRYGTPLGASQLDATCTIPGTFTYTPDHGAVLSVGNAQTLTATFTPADTANYSSGGTVTTTINVDPYTGSPVVTVPTDLEIPATGPSGASATYAASASDALGLPLFSDDFESPVIATGTSSYPSGGPSGSPVTFGNWVFSSWSGIINGQNGAWGGLAPYGGSQYALIQSYPGSGGLPAGQGSIQTAHTYTLVAGQSYTVWWAQASRPYSGGPLNQGGVLTYAVSVNGPQGNSQIFSRSTASGEGWQLYAATFTAASSGPAAIEFGIISPIINDNTAFIDSVSLTTTGSVAEPGTPSSGSTFPLGTTNVSVTATNIAGNVGSNTFNVIVDQAVAIITFATPTNYVYDGTPKVAIATTSPTGLTPTFAYDGGSASAPVNAGNHPVTATVNLPWVAGSASGTVAIAQATPSIAVTPYTVTYDGNAHTAPVTATGVSGVDLSGDVNLTGTTHTSAGVYNGDAWSFADPNGNYSSTGGSVNDSIAKANATIVVAPYNLTFDGNAHTAGYSATGVKGESLSGVNVSATTHTNAGTTIDTWTYTDVTGNYNNSGANVTDVIAKANATVAVTPYSVTYDGNAHTATGTVTGAGAVSLSGLDLSATTRTNAGTTTDTWSFTDSTGNYNNATGTVSDTIAKANATIAVTPYSVTYDGNAHTATYAVSGVKTESLAGMDVSGTTRTNAGTTTDTWSFTDSTGNYNNATGTVSDTIAKANATIVVTPYSVTYDGNPHTATYAVSGVKTESLAGMDVSGTTRTNAGTTTDTWNFTDSTGNYNSATGTVSDTIAKANATIVVTPYSVTYDGNAHTATYAVTGVKTESLAGMDVSGTTRTNAGTTTDTWNFTDSTGNYNNATGAVKDAIAKANATIVVTPYSVTYDGNAHTASYTAAGVKGEALAGMNVSATTHTVAKTYPGDAWTYTDQTGNYANSSGTVTDTISRANVVVTVTPYSVTYDGNAHTATGSVAGVNGETPNAGLSLSGTTHTAAGPYTDTWTYTDQTGNYNNSTGTVSDMITKAAATISVTPYNVTYDAKAHTATGTATGIGGATLAGLSLTGTTHTDAGSYSDPWTFTDPTGNYQNASASITDKIAQATPTIVLAPLSQMYTGTARVVTVTTTPTVAPADIDVTYAGSSTAPILPGSYPVVATITDPNYTGSQTGTLTVATTGLVRQGITLNGEIEGSIQVLSAQNDTLNGNALISGDLLVTGTPTILANGHPTYGGTITYGGAPTPSNYTITLNGNVSLAHVGLRVNPLTMPTVSAPPKPTGTQSVTINSSGQAAPNWSTANNVTLNGNTGSVSMPAGAYGTVIVNGNSTLVLGVAGATTPSVYNLQGLTVNGNGALKVVGPVVINSAATVSANGNFGISTHPEWLTVYVSAGGVTLNGNVTFYGSVVAPTAGSGQVTINGDSSLTGGVVADSLIINGNGVLVQPSP